MGAKEDVEPMRGLMSEKSTPSLHPYDWECCGCSACCAICPLGAIKMLPDRFGFLYPEIDKNLCVGCKKCVSVCDFKNA